MLWMRFQHGSKPSHIGCLTGRCARNSAYLLMAAPRLSSGMMKESSCHCTAKPPEDVPKLSQSCSNLESKLPKLDEPVVVCLVCLLRDIELRRLELATSRAAACCVLCGMAEASPKNLKRICGMLGCTPFCRTRYGMPHCLSTEPFIRCDLLFPPELAGKSTQPITCPSARTTVNVQYKLLSSSYQ